MPRIKNIRIINAQYNHGKQMYQDFRMPLNGLSSTYILGNGGGKSVLVMLIMQCIIPNYTLNTDKPFKSMFKGGDPNRTTHVLVEWELDSEISPHKTLLTGFCAKKRTSSDENDTMGGVEYFNYTHLYDSNNDMDIHRIPLCHMDENTFVTVSLDETRKVLYDNQNKYNIWIGKMNGKSEYQQHIKQFCILGAEGKLMGSINESENQLRSHFKKSYGTSRTVIEKLLLNTTIECLNDKRIISGHEHDETSTESLASTLIQSQEDIKRLNDELEKERETRAYHAEIAKLIDANGRLLNAHKEFEDAKKQTAIQCAAYRSKVTEQQGLIRGIESDLDEAKEQRNVIDIYISKLKVMQQNAALNKSTANVSHLGKEKENIEIVLESTEHKRKLAIATNKLIDIHNCEDKILEYQRTIDNLSKNHEDVFCAYNTYGKTLYLSLSEELANLTTRYKGEESEKDELGKQSSGLGEKIGEIKSDIKTIDNALGKLNLDFDQAQSDEITLLNKCRTYPQLNNGLLIPEDELSATTAYLETLRNKQNTLHSTKEELQLFIHKDDVEKSRFAERVDHINDLIEQKSADISFFETQLSDAMDVINVRKSMDISTCLAELDAEIVSTYGIILSKRRDLEQSRRELRTVDEYGFTLTEEFEDALTWFKDKFEFASSGAEYLKELHVDKQKTVLECAPWLPKAIILSDYDYNRILANPTGRLTNTIMDSSIILVSLSNIQKNAKISLGDVFIPSRDTEHSIKILDKENTIKRILSDIQKIEQDIAKYESSLTIARRDSGILESFTTLYPEGYEAKLRNQLEQYEANLAECNNTLSEITGRINDNTRALEQTQTDLSDVDTKLDTFSEKHAVLTKLVELIPKIKELEADIHKEARIRNDLLGLLDRTKNAQDQLSTRIREKDEIVKSLSRQKDKLELHIAGELSIFKDKDVEIRDEKDPSILWAEYESAKSITNRVAGDVNQLEKTIKENEDFIQKLHTEINRDQISIEEIKALDHSRPFSEEYISDLRTQFEGTKEKLRSADKELLGAREHHGSIKSKFESMVSKHNTLVTEAYIPDPGIMDETQFRDEISAKKTELNRLDDKINGIEKSYESGSEKLKQFESNLEKYELLCGQYRIAIAAIDTRVELKLYEELKSMLANRDKNVDDNKRKFQQAKEKAMNNIQEIDMRDYIKTPIRDKLSVAGTLEAAESNSTALETYLNVLINRLKEQQQQIDSLKKIERNVVDLALGIARMYKGHLKKFPLLSKIKFKNETYDMIKINFDRCTYPDEQAELEMQHYIRDLIRDIEANKIDKSKLVDCLAPVHLISRVLDMRNIQLEMRKIEQNDIQRFLRWEQIEASDGQTNAIFIIFLVVLMSYIRDIVIDRKDIKTSKMMIVDNPFGSTSGSYLWETIVSILEKNNVQMICPAHTIKADVLKYFPIHFTLTTEPSASGRQRVGIKVHAKDEILNSIERQQRYGQITLDI